ncbi:MAG TPA: acetylglutamate kinase [Oligoflexia bacterium]|nr:acetylglutamate kinase [Oligoflexia bacterium]HMP48630.1 acetylglutamate kinase [Oligoflexia bacterium]
MTIDNKVADAFIESLPYLKKFKDEVVIIKLGGSALSDSEIKRSMSLDISFLRAVGISVVIVHGGGKDVSKMLSKLGKETRFVGGYRYTSPEDADIVEMVLSGSVNKSIVSILTLSGCPAVGLSGKDSGLLSVEDLKGQDGEDLGNVGRIVETRPAILKLLLENAIVPVVSSIASSYDGRTMNINADELACAIAVSLDAKKLIYLSDVDGLILDGELVDELDLREAEVLIGDSRVTGGMIPKLEFSANALRKGVADVHLINGKTPHSVLLELFTERGIGTKLTYSRRKSAPPSIR